MSTPEQQAQKMIENLPEKTGRSLQEWLPLCRESKISKHGELVTWLKSEHAVTHGFANLIAQKTLTKAIASEGIDLIAVQYSGDKAKLQPIYDAIVQVLKANTSDIEIAPKKAYVSLRRKKQFALIQASTKSRVDVGINLKDVPATERLEKSASFSAMVSHRVRVTSADEVDAELISWLLKAWDQAG